MSYTLHDRSTLEFRSSMASAQHLLLDSEGVLFDDSIWKRWLLGLLGHIGLHTHYAAFFRLWDFEYQPRVCRGECDFATALHQFLLTAGLAGGQAEEILAATRAKMRVFDNEMRPYPGVRRTVNYFGTIGAELSVVRRFTSRKNEVTSCLARLGLDNRLRRVIVTNEPRHMEDATSYYRWIASQACWQSHEFVYVGRHAIELRGAAAAGMTTIAFNHDADAEADYYIDQFDQLIGLLPSPTEVAA